jgi:menaquinone-9 beta-reductase
LRQPEKTAVTAALRQVEHLVIGGGPAGSFAALRLAAAGRQVVLLERETVPHHKVCGEFLSREAVDYLHQAGVAPLELGAAVIRTLRLSAGSRAIETPLPFQALSLSRHALDSALLAHAEVKGCQVLRGVTAESLAAYAGQWLVALNNGGSMHAANVFLATGKHDLRGLSRAPAKQSDLVGFKLHWQLAPAQLVSLREVMDLFLFPGGYGGLSLIEGGVANLCLVVRRSTLRRLGGWPELLAEILRGNRHLHKLLSGASQLWPRPLAISPIPYGYLTAQPHGLWRLGDQAAVIPSFTGDGISIALHSAALAAQMFLAGSSAADYSHTLRAQLTRSMTLAAWLSRSAVTAVGRAVALPALTLAPNAMRWIAMSTRIPQYSIVLTEFPLEGAGSAARQSA